jgi:hypothetical protein
MKRSFTDDQFLAVARRSQAWRFTQLHDALTAEFDCCPSTAQRAINRAVRFGLLIKLRGVYQLADDSTLAASNASYRRLDRRELLCALAERPAWRYTDMLAALRTRLGASESTIRTSLKYAQDFGYLERRSDGWALTDQCRRQLSMYGRLEGAEGFQFATFTSGQPKRGFHRWHLPHQPTS